jgi:methyl-accepting chemotaxis protein
LILICTSFTLPILALGYLWLSTQQIQIDFAEKEIIGNRVLRPAVHLMQDAVDYHMALASGVSVRDRNVIIDEALKELTAAEKGAFGSLSVGESLQSVRQSWTTARERPSDFESLIVSTRAFITAVGDQSNLILDPDLDSYYMMDLTLLRVPETLDLIRKLHISVEQARAEKNLSVDVRTTLVVLSGLLKTNLDGIQTSFQTAVRQNADGSVRAKVMTAYQSARSELEALLAAVDEIITAGTTNDAAFERVRYQATQSLTATRDMYDAAVDELDLLLHRRIDGFYSRVWNAFSMVALVLIVTMFLVIVIVRSITQPLRDAVRVSNELADGNLGVEFSAPTRDETGQLFAAMEHMVVNWRTIIERLSQSSSQVASTSDQLAASSRQISSGAEEQSSATEETSASMEQMAASIRQVAMNSEQLSSNVSETSASIQQMMASIQSVARHTSDLSGAVSETSSTIQEMAASIEQVAVNAREVGKFSSAAVKEAEDGFAAVREAVEGMNTLASTMKDIVAVIRNLDDSSNAISRIVDVIDDIAEQTNLLALNAAIEAARAGEHGRGFAVVADEIRKLAERSAASAKEIVQLIGGVQKETQNAIRVTQEGQTRAVAGVHSATQAGDAFGKIVQGIGTVSRMVNEIGKATEQQAKASEQMVQTVDNMTRMTNQVHTATREQANGSQQIMKAVEMMNTMTKQVSLATGEQHRGGEQVVRAVENIAKIAEQNVSASSQIVEVSRNLSTQAEELRKIASTFSLSMNDRMN